MLRSAINNIVQLDRLRGWLAGAAARRLRVPAGVAAFALLLTFLVYGLAVVPAAARLRSAHEGYAELKQQHADALLFQKQKQALAGLNKGIMTQKDVPLLIKDLVLAARARNLMVGTVSSDIPTPAASGLTVLTFTVPLTGSYSGIKRYLYEIETADRLVGIQDLRLASDKSSVKLDLKLVTYIRGD